MKKIKNLFKSLLLIPIILPNFVLAQTDAPDSSTLLGKLALIGGKAGYNISTEVSTAMIVGIVLRTLIGLLGLVFIILIILAGFKWMRANGNEEEVKKATQSIKEAIIGLVLTLSAWTIWTFVFEKLILGL